MSGSTSVHFSSAADDWETPGWVLELAREVLGPIDLDPASSLSANDRVKAARIFTKDMDSLAQEWAASALWLNSPYGRAIKAWQKKLVQCYQAQKVQQALTLVPARTDTAWWKGLQEYPVCFFSGRLKFGTAVNSAPFPSAIIYLGPNPKRFFQVFRPHGSIYVPFD